MSTPRCIRLAIRACRPTKISSPAPQCQRRFLATTQHRRDDDKIDIKAGFPSVPASEDDGPPQFLRQDAPDAHPTRAPIPAAAAAPGLGVIIERATEPPRQERDIPSYNQGRRLKIVDPDRKLHLGQVRELFSDYDVESIPTIGHKFGIVVLKTTNDADRAIEDLSGRELPAHKPKPKARQQPQPPSTSPEQPKPNEKMAQAEHSETSNTEITMLPPSSTQEIKPRLPLNVVAAYHKPLRHDPTFGIRVASLQLRSYSVRNLEFMCDFALRAAYFLGLPASGPVPLPKKIERWTMPRSNFVHKKSQENFERITRRRAIQILDGHKDVVQIWLAYLRKHQFYGVGMKADVWEFEGMDVAGSMDAQFQEVEKQLDEKLNMFGWNKQVAGDQSLTEQLRSMGPGQQTGVSMQYLRKGSRSESRL